jgi:hypothetical protein
MDLIRSGGPAGGVVAVSRDGTTFATPEGVHFADRSDDVFRMADGSVGTRIGAVIFVQNEEGQQTPVFWLESASPDPSE